MEGTGEQNVEGNRTEQTKKFTREKNLKEMVEGNKF